MFCAAACAAGSKGADTDHFDRGQVEQSGTVQRPVQTARQDRPLHRQHSVDTVLRYRVLLIVPGVQ